MRTNAVDWSRSRLAAPWLYLVAAAWLSLAPAGCLLSTDEAAVASPREVPASPSPEGQVPESAEVWAHPAGSPTWEEAVDDAEVTGPLGEVLLGDFTCLGQNLPASPAGEPHRVSGRTVHFGTDVVAPGMSVLLLGQDGSALAETMSDDRGRFEAQVPDTHEARLAAIETWQPGFVRIRHASTHPLVSFGEGVVLGALRPADVMLAEAAAGVRVDEEERGSVVVRAYDCRGEPGVAGVRLAIEGAPTEVFYASSRFELSRELEATTEAGYAYLFNLDPGVYTLAAWGFTPEAGGTAVLLNRAVVEVAAGQLTMLDIHPE